MKTLTLLQAAALLMLAVFGAYAGQGKAAPGCSTAASAAACDR